jgi:hypothetical protein
VQFANPIWLAGLGGILIPLAIHLLNRKEGKVIRIGSIRHFEETSTRQFKSIKLNEVLLLILRSLLILLIVFFMAQLQWPGNRDGETNWVLVEKGLDHDTEASKLIDSLIENGFEKRAFAKDFPVAADTIKETADNYWTLIESLSNEQLDSVVIVSANRSNAFVGERKPLPSNVAWINKSLAANEAVIRQVRLSADSIWTRSGKFDETESEFTTQITASSTSVKSPDTVQVVVVSDKKYAYDAKLILASLKAIDRYEPNFISITTAEPASYQGNKDTNWIFLFSDQTLKNENEKLIVLKPKPAENIIEQQTATSWIITKRLTPENVTNENLTSQLTQLFFPETESWNKAKELDVRASDDRLIKTNTTSSSKAEAKIFSGEALWIILIALTFIAERIVAYKRMQ